MLTLFVRSVMLFGISVLAMRLMGKRQVGQLQPFELVVVMMIAELAASPMGDVGVPMWQGVLPVLALVACRGVIAHLCVVSEKFRVWMCGQPTILVRDGVICEKQMRRMAMTLDDLMECMRQQGVMDPGEVGWAVLETSGTVTVFPKAENRAVTPEDLKLKVAKDSLPLPLVMDGHVQQDNLRRGGLTEKWLQDKLAGLGYASEAQVLFACLNDQDMLLVQGKGRTEMQLVHAGKET